MLAKLMGLLHSQRTTLHHQRAFAAPPLQPPRGPQGSDDSRLEEISSLAHAQPSPLLPPTEKRTLEARVAKQLRRPGSEGNRPQ